jgi:hydroxyacylglutathione hydrolase
MFLRQIFDPYLAQYAYLIGCQRTGEALLIDPERDVDRYQQLARENNLRITAVAETHIHADFVSGAREFAEDPDLHLYLSGEGGPDWSYRWTGDRPNTHILLHGDKFQVGNIEVEAVLTPGHTPEHLSYLITDLGGGADVPIALATGDFLFVGDVGRPDLLESAAGMQGVMEPSARVLRQSLVERLEPLTDYLQILPGHGAGSACGKALGAVPTSTLGYERRFNSALKLAQKDGETFVKDILSGQPEPPLYFATMKRVNRDGISVTGGVLRNLPELDPVLFQGMTQETGVRILDTRQDAKAFAQGHVPRAIHAPLRSPFFSTAAGSYVGETDPIFLVVNDAEDVDLAVRQLYRIGLDRILGWISSGKAESAGLMNVSLPQIAFPEFDPIAARQSGEIIDVRTTIEFEKGHMEGAHSYPYTRLKAVIDTLPRDRRLHVHCGSGKRAALAASFLLSEGFDAVHIDGICKECERIAQGEGVAH